ncbi:MAG TPA: hypothetical protein VMX55_10090 [candidate division Zixibacteria bacterium]|nr:hypothetical protein [candidate division Zixibacteria bacterium]
MNPIDDEHLESSSDVPVDTTSSKEDSQIKKSRFKLEMIRLGEFLKAIFNKNTIHLMLAHHPACEVYDSHVFKIGSLRLCKGCFLSYPPLYATLLIFIFWDAARIFYQNSGFLIPNIWWFVISFGILTIGGYLIGKISLFIKDLSKFGRGAWAGALVIVILLNEIHWGFKIGAAVILIVGMVFLSLYRGKDMERTCNECEWKAQFDLCPGWRDVIPHFKGVIETSESDQTENTPIE